MPESSYQKTQIVDSDGNILDSLGSGGGTGGTADFTQTNTRLGATTEPAATSISAASGLNGLLRFFIGKFTTTTSGLKTDGSGVVQPVSATALPLPHDAASNSTLVEVRDRLGATTDPAPALATSASGLLGLVRYLFGLLPSALAGDRFKVESIVKSLSPPIITESALIAPGTTPTQSIEGYYKATYQVNVLGVTNAVLRMEGNVTGSDFANLNESGSDKTITTAGVYLFKFEGLVSNVRMNLVSVAGSAPSIIAHLKKGN